MSWQDQACESKYRHHRQKMNRILLIQMNFEYFELVGVGVSLAEIVPGAQHASYHPFGEDQRSGRRGLLV